MSCILSGFYNRVLSQMGSGKRMAPRATVSLVLGMVFLMMIISPALSQQLPPPPPPRMPKDLPMQSTLYDAEQLAATERLTLNQLKEQLGYRDITLSAEGLVHVEIVGPEGEEALSSSVITRLGGQVDTQWRHRLDAWVPIEELANLARALPSGYFLEEANVPDLTDVAGEGPGVINSDSYRDGGADGTGLTIAVIDQGYINLTAAWNNGDIPQTYHWTNYTPEPLEATTEHGTGCVEAAYDHCPGATWRLYKTDSMADLGAAVGDAIANGVDVISISLAYFITGWHDGSGDACALANLAATNGILFFCSAGNYAQSHWQGLYESGFGDPSWHDWYNGDESIDIVIDDGVLAKFLLQWNTDGGTYDYDLYLFDSSLQILASSTQPDNYFEKVTWTNNTGSSQTVHLAVWRDSGGVTEFEIFGTAGTWQEYIVSASSTPSPANTPDPRVIASGAVEWADFNSPSGTSGIIASYSSQGPSNDGMILPDICGPTKTTGFTYPDGMGGTSASTPNNAGAFCAFWSADPLLGASSVRWLMDEQATLWKDWGISGPDNIYGYGGTILVDYVPNTLWVARSADNTADSRSAPFYTVQAAHDWAVSGGRLLIFPGGNYPEPATLNKALTVETVEYSAILGQ
jgi:hypothetical protein